MKQGFATATVLLLIGLIAIFTIAVFVGQGTGIFSNAQSAASLGLTVDVQNVSGKAKIVATWKGLPRMEYRFGLFKGSNAIGTPVIPLTITKKTSFTSDELTLENGKYTFFLSARRSGVLFPATGNVVVNGTNIVVPHIDQDPDGGFGGNLHGGGPSDRPRTDFNYFVDSVTFEWNGNGVTPSVTPSVTPTLTQAANQGFYCYSLKFYSDNSGNKPDHYQMLNSITTAKPGEVIAASAGVVNNSGKTISGVKNNYRLSGDAKFTIVDMDSECSMIGLKRLSCGHTDYVQGGRSTGGAFRLKILSSASVGNTIKLTNNLTASNFAPHNCQPATLTIVPQ